MHTLRERRKTIQEEHSIPTKEKPLLQVYVPEEGAYVFNETVELYEENLKVEEYMWGKPCLIFDM
eukprot:6023042-Amphidinium_carterae.1